jgi:serine/threonine-protein kinase/endoribonuclease IRE1
LTFLQDASDRFEIMCRDPRDQMLVELEKGAFAVVGNDWHARLDKVFQENLGKFRKYDGKSVQDLMRALRNKVRPVCHVERPSLRLYLIETSLSRLT